MPRQNQIKHQAIQDVRRDLKEEFISVSRFIEISVHNQLGF